MTRLSKSTFLWVGLGAVASAVWGVPLADCHDVDTLAHSNLRLRVAGDSGRARCGRTVWREISTVRRADTAILPALELQNGSELTEQSPCVSVIDSVH